MSFFRPVLNLLTSVLSALSFVAVVALLVRWGLQFQHPAKWDALGVVIHLRNWVDPLLVGIGNWSGLTWVPEKRSWLPVILVGVVGFAYSGALNVIEWLTRGRPPAPPQPGAVQAGLATVMAAPGTLPPGTVGGAASGAPMGSTAGMSTQFSPRGAGSGVDPAAATSLQPMQPVAQVSPARSGLPGQIGRYEIQQKLGQGAMGIVYKARDTQIGRIVALKSILAADMSDPAVDEYRKRFLQEAQSAGKLNHPGIVTVHDLTTDAQGQPCLVMEFIEGTTLDKVAGAGERLPVERILDLMVQVSTALAHAHAHGIVHRDIKPANIMVTQNGQAKVSDFGIAKMAGSHLTMTGQIIGTPGFMSPEQFTGGHVDARSDLFSLGAVMYWLCTGERPFPGDTITAIAYKVVNSVPAPARQMNPAVPEALERIIMRCLEKDPSARYPDAQMLANDLAAVRSHAPGEMTLPGVKEVASG